MLGYVGAAEQRPRRRDDPRGEVLGQLAPHGAVDDLARRGEQPLDLTTGVGGVPGRVTCAEPDHCKVDQPGAVQRPRTQRRHHGRNHGRAVSQLLQLLDPPLPQFLARSRDHLVGAGVGPRAAVPRLPQGGPGLLARVVGPPVGFVGVDVGLDLPGSGAERPGVGSQLDNLAGLGVHGQPVRSQGCPERRVGHHGGVTDAVDRLQTVADTNGVQAPPLTLGEHPGVDLEMQVPMWVPSPGCEVMYDGRLDLFDWHLYLPIARPDPGGGMGSEPTDDLLGRRNLRGVVRLGDLGMQRGRERPRFRPVDGDLDEPHRLVVLPQPALGSAGLDVEAAHPLLIRLAVHVWSVLDALGGGGDPHGNAAALGEVVVVGTRTVGLDVVAGCRRCTPVDLQAAVHRNHLRQ